MSDSISESPLRTKFGIHDIEQNVTFLRQYLLLLYVINCQFKRKMKFSRTSCFLEKTLMEDYFSELFCWRNFLTRVTCT